VTGSLPNKTPRGPMARWRERWFYILAAPWLVGLVFFQAGPILGTLLLSFADWRLPAVPYYVGLDHFITLAGDPLFWRTLLNTLYYTAGTVPLGIGVGLGLALLLNTPRRTGRFFRTLFFLPVILSGTATILVWGWLFNPRYGAVNSLLALIGIQGPGWLFDKHWAMPALILMSLWNCGINIVIYLAALQNIPQELVEAAALEGATRWRRFWHVIWPLLSPVTFYLVVANMIGAFQVFTPSYLLTRGGPDNATLTLPLYIYLNAFSWGKMGYAAALGMMLLAAVMALTLFQFHLGRRWVFNPRAAQ
jgi:multiple sugar transport system permease protein